MSAFTASELAQIDRQVARHQEAAEFRRYHPEYQDRTFIATVDAIRDRRPLNIIPERVRDARSAD